MKIYVNVVAVITKNIFNWFGVIAGSIISIGGQINVNEGSSVMLSCETLTSNPPHNIIWKRDNRQISNKYYGFCDFIIPLRRLFSENPNLKIFPNNSLEIKAVEKYGIHVYLCATEYDNIEYTLNVLGNSYFFTIYTMRILYHLSNEIQW